MNAIAFDTHKFVRKLKDSGLPESQAEAIAEAFKDATGEAEIATKRGIERLESRMVQMETSLTGEMKLLKWMTGATFGGVMFILLRLFLQTA